MSMKNLSTPSCADAKAGIQSSRIPARNFLIFLLISEIHLIKQVGGMSYLVDNEK